MPEPEANPTQEKPSIKGDWYSHPDLIGKTKGRVGGGCCSWGCAITVCVILGILALIQLGVEIFVLHKL